MKEVVVLVPIVLSLLSGEATIPSPPPDPGCIQEPFFIRAFEDHPWCNAQEDPYGDHYLYACRITKHSESFGDYTSFKFLHTCVYSATSSVRTWLTFLPLVQNKPTTMSHLP